MPPHTYIKLPDNAPGTQPTPHRDARGGAALANQSTGVGCVSPAHTCNEVRISSLQGGMDKTKKEEKKERNTNKYPEDSTVRTLSIPTA